MANAIEAYGLVKKYGKVTALAGLDLAAAEGTVLGVLGPNGAGKTTAVSILTTLIEPDAGEATIAGIDLRKDPHGVRSRIGLSGQAVAVDEQLTGFENLDMIGRLYRLGRTRSRERATELLERFDLTEAAGRTIKTYSGGMRRRLDLAGALIAEPPVLFLDEPTAGLDPRSRNDLWTVIRELVGRGTTLLLTTQYLEEADQLANDIVVIDHGREIAHGTSRQLKRMIGGERIEVAVISHEDTPKVQRILAAHASGEIQHDPATNTLVAPIAGGAEILTQVLRALDAEGVMVEDIGLRRPTLDDVFLAITGRHAEEAPVATGEAVAAGGTA
ncbi:MAG TPA: daunorubicin/doxorubicin resistance ABC transporter ATP-binding protein DrrA [Actinobacteria bacterium]|nr:daunorubicin/doxorubicin resistance ABC transporter ATP-binding protein DrrA [Actinomycetota bacterium]